MGFFSKIWRGLLGLFGGKKSSPPAQTQQAPVTPVPIQKDRLSLSLDPSKWYQEYVAAGGITIPANKPIGKNLPGADPSALSEAIPDRSENKFISYLLFPIQPTFSSTSADPTPKYIDISEYKSLTIRFRIKAPKGIKWFYDSEPGNTPDKCPTPGHIRPFLSHAQLQLQNWTWRWFAHYLDNSVETAAYPVADGLQEVTLTVPLAQDHWVSVYPGRDPAAEKQGWDTMIHSVSYFGLVFGGGCAYGHGLNLTGGSVSFELLEFSLSK